MPTRPTKTGSLPLTHLLPLIRACKESPDDDVPRLVLSDWLEEHGDAERAEFIRLQCEPNHPVPGHAYRLSGFGCWGRWRLSEQLSERVDPADERKWERERELFQQHRERWLGSLAPWYAHNRFYRGFIGLENDTPSRLGHSFFQDCLRLMPAEEAAWIDSLQVNFGSRGGLMLPELSRYPFFPGLVRLTLGAGDLHPEDIGQQGDPLGRHQLQALLALPDMPVLRRLSFANYAFTPDDIAALVAAPWFGRLTDLALTWGWAGRSLCKRLAARTGPTALTSLRIRDVSEGLDDASVEALGSAACLTELRELDLYGNEGISDRGLRALADAPFLQGLRYLDLRDCRAVTPEGVTALRDNPRANGVQILH